MAGVYPVRMRPQAGKIHSIPPIYRAFATIGSTMKRRILLQWAAAAAAMLPFERVRLLAQPRDLTAESIATLRAIAPTVLPSSIGAERTTATVDKFVAWTRGYREGVPTTHGYGHPRLQRTGASPVPGYNLQLTALDKAARDRGGQWSALDL